MVQFTRSISVAVAVSSLILCHLGSFANADPIVELRLDERDEGPPEASFYGMKQGGDEFGAMPLNGRDLVRSWLGKRACVDAGYYACTSSYGCCPNGSTCCSLGCCRSGKSCCPNSLYCADPGDKCCGSRGTCESGWNCCGTVGCYPDGGECCSNGRYCSAGNKCYIVNGRNACCTDSKCTAHVSNGITSTRGGGGSDDTRTTAGGGSGATTTSETFTTPTLPASDPTATIPVVSINYYFTYSWYYVSWYWYYYTFVASTSSSTTSTTVTTSTIFTISEANSASARSSYREMTSTFPTAAPAEASAILTGGAGASSTAVTGIGAGGSNFTATSIQSPNGGNGNAGDPVTVTGGAVSSTGSASSGSQSGARKTVDGVSWVGLGFMVLSLGSGMAMVWL